MPEEVQTKTPVKRGPELGHDRWGGRKKRSASKARDIAESLGVDPIRWMLNLIKNGTYQQAVVDADGKKKESRSRHRWTCYSTPPEQQHNIFTPSYHRLLLVEARTVTDP